MGREKNNDRVPVSKVDEAIKLLQDLKPKERDDVSDREAVRKMRRYIEKLTSSKYGYTYDEVSEMLKGLGINLSGSRIKYLIGELRKSSRHRQKTADDNNPSSETSVETQPTVNASSEADKLPGNSGKGKRKNQQLTAQQPEDKSVPQSQADKMAFVPELYRDEDL